MKVAQISKNPEFTPIEVNLTIQSRRELEYFWALMNCGKQDQADNANNGLKYIGVHIIKKFTMKDIPDTAPFWDILEENLKHK